MTTTASTPITMSLQLDYNQLLGLAMQLNEEEKLRLCRALSCGSRALRLRQLRDNFATDQISEEDILKECELVRQELYEARK